MKKQLIALCLMLSVLMALSVSAFASDTDGPVTAASATGNTAEMVSIQFVSFDQVNYQMRINLDQDLADAGYWCSVEISPYSTFRSGDDHYSTRYYDVNASGAHSNETVSGSAYPYLVPNCTYYARAVIHNNYGQDVYTGSEVVSFTTPADNGAFTAIQLTDSMNVTSSGRHTYLRYTTNAAGLYHFTASSNISEIYVCAEDASELAHSYKNDSEDLEVTFYAKANTTIYFYIGYGSSSSQVSLLRWEESAGKLELNAAREVASEEIVLFTASKQGYYKFAYTDTETDGYFRYLNEQEDWTWIYSNSYIAKLNAGETLMISPDYYSSAGLLSLIVTEVTPPSSDSIAVGAAYDVTNTSFSLDLTISTSDLTARNGYRYGFVFSHDPTLENTDGGVYSATTNEIMHSGKNTFSYDSFYPGQHVYYKAVLVDNDFNVICESSPIRSVTLDSGMDGFTSLALDVPADLTGLTRPYFYYTAPADGIYTIQTDGPLNTLNVRLSNGVSFGAGNNPSSYLHSFQLLAGETVYIFVSNWSNNSTKLTLSSSGNLPADSTYVCPASLTEIHEEAFAGLPVQTLILSENIRHIYAGAFAGCTALESVVIPVASVAIDDTAFSGCPAVSISAPAGGSVEQFANNHGLTFFALSS